MRDKRNFPCKIEEKDHLKKVNNITALTDGVDLAQLLKDFVRLYKNGDYHQKINLHIHSVHSDGEMTPDEIIEKAVNAGLETISITDHNTVDAYNNISYKNLNNLSLITGVEFDCWHKTDFMHILGYGIDINNGKLQNLCAKSKKETEFDIIRIFSRRSAKQVIEAIKEAGGVSVLAHPACCWNLRLKRLIKELKSFGLDGLEVYYPYVRHRAVVKFHTVRKIEKIANELNLLKTGGTDCHGLDIMENT